MIITTKIKSLQQTLELNRNSNKTVGLVPTMGALHEGHVSLINLAKNDCDIVICSIFINPTQFNDSNDLNNYPIETDKDSKLLNKKKCDILFLPDVKEMYPEGLKSNKYNLNGLDNILEGKHRQGHFDGVCTIIHKLFSIITPDYSYFGMKDFQQVAVVRQLTRLLNLPVEIKTGNTIRESDGLAKSSRNRLLSSCQRKRSTVIFESLTEIKKIYGKIDCIDLKKIVKKKISCTKEMQLDYIEIINPTTFKPIKGKGNNEKAVALIAVFVGNLRLIDNLALND